MSEFGMIVTTSAAKQIAERIRQAILDGRIVKNEQLPTETELAAQFGVSRPTIREALKRLAAQNLIRSRRGPAGGTFIKDYDVEDASEVLTTTTMLMASLGTVKMSEITAVRLFMETECCKAVIRNWNEDTAARIDTALAALMDESISDAAFCDADVAFHRAIVNAGDNAMMRFMMYAVIEALVPVMNMVIVFERDRREIVGFHQRIRDGLFARDEADVVSALADLSSYISDKHEAARARRSGHGDTRASYA